MFRVLSILVALPMLVPHGMCLRKLDGMGWLLRTPASSPATSHSPARTERADARHPSSCRCGCQERAAGDRDATDDGRDLADDQRVRDNSPPPPQEPCCPTICKSKLDKIVQVENPQPCGEVAFSGFVPVPVTTTCTPQPHFLRVVADGPPLYISFCTFLI